MLLPFTLGAALWNVALSKDGANALSDREYGWICLDLDDAAEGSVLNCWVPDA